jgi:hypothetical protein
MRSAEDTSLRNSWEVWPLGSVVSLLRNFFLFTTAFSVSGPHILVSHIGSTDMERDTLAQL